MAFETTPSPLPIAVPFPTNEIAEVHVGGGIYRDWETVLIRYELNQTDGTIELTTSEFDPMPSGSGSAFRIIPGDPIIVFLAGQLAGTGWVNLRQAAYDANTHGVLIHARAAPQKAIDSSHIPENGGQYKGQSLSAIAQTALSRLGLNFVLQGPDQKFEDVQTHFGESVNSFIDRLARTAGMHILTNEHGDFIVTDGKSGSNMGELREGINILKGSCTLRNDGVASQYVAVGQNGGTPDQWGAEITQMAHVIAGATSDPSRAGVTILHTVERAMNAGMLSNRNNFESAMRSATEITAEITVFGWLKGGRIWHVGDQVSVYSPMLMLFGTSLYIRAVTFTQEVETGSLTVLELTNRPEGSQQQAAPASNQG